MNDSIKEERIKILELLQEGTITTEEAESLLSAIANSKAEPQIQNKSKKFPFKMLKIIVDSSDGDKVRVNIPLEFAKLLKNSKFGNVDLNDFAVDLDSILEMISGGASGEIVNIQTEDGDEVRILFE